MCVTYVFICSKYVCNTSTCVCDTFNVCVCVVVVVVVVVAHDKQLQIREELQYIFVHVICLYVSIMNDQKY
jgi:hypothetical protein